MDESDVAGGMPCTKCGEYHALPMFRVRRGKPQQPCKKCYLEYGRRHYQNNKPYYIAKAKRYNDAHWERTQRLLWAYLREHPCVDCGNNDPRVFKVRSCPRREKAQCWRFKESALSLGND